MSRCLWISNTPGTSGAWQPGSATRAAAPWNSDGRRLEQIANSPGRIPIRAQTHDSVRPAQAAYRDHHAEGQVSAHLRSVTFEPSLWHLSHAPHRFVASCRWQPRLELNFPGIETSRIRSSRAATLSALWDAAVMPSPITEIFSITIEILRSLPFAKCGRQIRGSLAAVIACSPATHPPRRPAPPLCA